LKTDCLGCLLEPDVRPLRGVIPNYAAMFVSTSVQKLNVKVPIVHQGKSNFTVGDRESVPFL
jgi:hypothetical protein